MGQAIIERKQMVGGVVVATTRKLPMVGNGPANRGPRAIRSSFGGGFARPVVGSSRQSASSRAIGSAGHPQRWIRVRLSERELARATPDLPVRVLPFGSTRSVMAYPSKLPPVADLQRDMMWLHYSLRGTGHGLKLRQRVRVEMLLSDTGKRRKVIPYSAVFYDKKGVSWTYVTRAPLQYMRERIRIDHIAGDLAVLSDGPALGTKIVTEGAAMLHGTEVYGN